MKLELQSLTCGYRGKALLEPLDLCIEQGGTVCILGPNGVGKTTFFKTMQGFLKPVSGNICIDGKPAAAYGDRREMARKIAYVPQIHGQPFSYTAMDMVLMGRTPYINSFASPGKADYEKCAEAMAMLEISHLAERNYAELSGGEQQMVLIARALAQEPSLLMMDEPTSNLDYGNKLHVLRHVLRLKEAGISVMMITHSPEHAFICADQVMLFCRDGRVICGETEKAMTEANLSAAYGIPVRVYRHTDEDGRIVTSCSPVM